MLPDSAEPFGVILRNRLGVLKNRILKPFSCLIGYKEQRNATKRNPLHDPKFPLYIFAYVGFFLYLCIGFKKKP